MSLAVSHYPRYHPQGARTTRIGMCSLAYGFPALDSCVFSVDTLPYSIQGTHPSQSKSTVGLTCALIFCVPGLQPHESVSLTVQRGLPEPSLLSLGFTWPPTPTASMFHPTTVFPPRPLPGILETSFHSRLLQVLWTWSHAGLALTVGPGQEYPRSALGALSVQQAPLPTLVLSSSKSLHSPMSLSPLWGPHHPAKLNPHIASSIL